jgi:HPt (histidine-containing phosphotransfer) domain-containing protein
LAHTLKSNAGQLDKTALQKAAEEVEFFLSDEKNNVTPEIMRTLKAELQTVLEELEPLAEMYDNQAKAQKIAPEDSLDAKEARTLIEELEPLLDGGSTECLKLIDRLRKLQGSGELIKQMENFQFDMAMEKLIKLKKT